MLQHYVNYKCLKALKTIDLGNGFMWEKYSWTKEKYKRRLLHNSYITLAYEKNDFGT